MDLGLIPYRQQGTNLLHAAVHDKNGVVWSDGRGIYLAPVSLSQGQVEQQQPTKLGEFDRGVKSIHWSEDIFDGFCYMCVVHDKNISIWKVEGHAPKLTFKQVRKVNIQPIQQGCLWCPERDILCVLCQHQASVYYSHIENKGSLVLQQLDSRDKIRCGCWLPDGSTLVICVGTSLTVYNWSDIDDSVLQYNHVSWNIPGLDGPVSSIVPLSNNRVICAAELPLESLCIQNNTFVLPDLLNTRSTVQELSYLADSDIIRPQPAGLSVKDSLLNLQRNPEAAIEDSSSLVIVAIDNDGDLAKVTGVKVKGILSPDILLYEPDSQQAIVGSNTQTFLQLFDVGENELTKSGEICLEKDERPKGISCVPRSVGQGHSAIGEGHSAILLLLGKKNPADSAFLSSSNNTTMKSVLKVFSIKKGKGEPKKPLNHTNSVPVYSNGQRNGSHPVQNGSLSVFKNNSHGDINVGQGHINGKNQDCNENMTKGYISDDFASLKSTQTKSCFDLSRTKESANIDYEKNVHGDTDMMKCKSVGNVHQESERPVAERPEPPRRPVRKKKSSRGKNDMPQRVVIERNKQTLSKMAMDYSSSSPDISPRLSGTVTQQNVPIQKPIRTLLSESASNSESVKTKNVQNYNSESVKTKNVQNNRNEMVTDKQHDITSTISSDISNNSKHSTITKGDSSAEEPPRDITLLLGRQEISNQSKIIELGSEDSGKELEIEQVDFDSQTRHFEQPNLLSSCFIDTLGSNYSKENLRLLTAKETSHDKIEENEKPLRFDQPISEGQVVGQDSNSETLLRPSRSLESLEDIDRLLKQQTESIAHLQEQVSDLNRRVNESSCVLSSRYQDSQNPEMVYVSFLCKDGSEIKKRFLLDNGRLKLEPVKQTFSLETVEIYIDNEACVTGCNIDGYIPMRFQTGTTIQITGKPSLSLV